MPPRTCNRVLVALAVLALALWAGSRAWSQEQEGDQAREQIRQEVQQQVQEQMEQIRQAVERHLRELDEGIRQAQEQQARQLQETQQHFRGMLEKAARERGPAPGPGGPFGPPGPPGPGGFPPPGPPGGGWGGPTPSPEMLEALGRMGPILMEGPGGERIVIGAGGGPLPGMMPGMPGPAPGAAIAVAEGKVYVVVGPTLYKFDAQTLNLEKQRTFIEPPKMGPPPPGHPGGHMGPPPPPAGP